MCGTLKRQFSSNPISRRLLTFFIAFALPIAPALAADPAPGLDSTLTWTTTGTPAWDSAASSSAVSGNDVARAAQADDAAMETLVSGPAVARFSWRLSGADGRGSLTLEIDGREMASLRRSLPWQRVEINLPPGEHTLRLRARGMARVPGALAEADDFVFEPGARLPWLANVDDDPAALWVVSGSGHVSAEERSLSGIDEGHVAAIRGTAVAGRTSLVRLVEGPARLVPWVNVKGGSFSARDLDAAGAPRRVNSPNGNTWDDAPLIIGPGSHRIEWVHFYWATLENEIDPYPQTPPANLVATPDDVATLASLTIAPLSLNTTIAGGQIWTSSGSNPFVPTLAPLEPNSLNRDQLAALAVELPGPFQDATLSTVIQGPAEVLLRSAFGGTDGDTFRILRGGEIQYESTAFGGIGSSVFEIPAGPTTVEIQWSSGAASVYPRKIAVTGIEVRQPLPAAIVTALDAPAALHFFTSHPGNWDSVDANPRSGEAARARPLDGLTFPELSTWVDGPAVLSYWRRAEGLPDRTSIGFPGIQDAFNPGPLTWQPVSLPVPAGRHRLVWRSPVANLGFFGATARYFLDTFAIGPATGIGAVPIADALETPGRTWTHSGSNVTSGAFGELAFDGIDAVSLAPADQINPAWIETIVSGPALVTFHSTGSLVAATLDGEYPAFGREDSGIADSLWTRTRLPVPPGEYLLRLAATDPNHPARIDQVEITATTTPSLADALDAPDLVFTSEGDRWQALVSPLAADGDALFASGQGSGAVATTIAGPALVKFEWQAGPDYTRLSLEIDGVVTATAPNAQFWNPVRIELPVGPHALRWVFTSSDQRRSLPAGLNSLQVSPLQDVTLATAVDATDRIWLTTGPPPLWTAQAEISHDGEDAAHVESSEDESIDGGNALQTTVTGPALVRFWWLKDGPGMVSLRMGDREAAALKTSDEWQEAAFAVPPGSHILTWTRLKNHYFEPRPALTVDDFRVVPVPAGLTLGEALDAPNLVWSTSPDAPWSITWRTTADGTPEPAVTSPTTPGSASWIETEVTGPAVVSFIFLDDSYGRSHGNLLIDGSPVLPLIGATWPDDPIAARFPIPAGPHTLRWEWNVALNNPSGSKALEAVTLDRVEIATDRPPFASLFPENLAIVGTGSHPWTVQPTPDDDGFRAESHPVLPGQGSGITATVAGTSATELAFRSGWAGLRANRVGGMFLFAGPRWLAIHGTGGYIADTMESVWHLPPGSDHELRWESSSASGVIDALFLDQIELTTPEIPLGEALGLPENTLLSTGGGRWFGQTATTRGNSASAVASTGSGSLITEFTGPGTVTWWWKSEGPPENATARLIVWPFGQPSIITTRSGNFGWERHQAILPWGQTFKLEWRATDTSSGHLIIDDVTFQESSYDAYTLWAAKKLIGGERAAMGADPDGDGQSNLMEFAFGSDPNSRRSAYTQDLRIEDGLIHLCLTRPDHDTSGLTYDLEYSPDLRNWSRLHRIAGGPSLPDVAITCPPPAEASGTRGFVRLSISFPN